MLLQAFLVTGLGGAGTMAGGGGLATALPPLGSDSLKLNCRKNSLVSLRWGEKCGKTVKMKKQLTCSSGTRIAAQTCPPRVKGPSRIWLICVKTGFHCSVSHRVLIIVMTPWMQLSHMAQQQTGDTATFCQGAPPEFWGIFMKRWFTGFNDWLLRMTEKKPFAHRQT